MIRIMSRAILCLSISALFLSQAACKQDDDANWCALYCTVFFQFLVPPARDPTPLSNPLRVALYDGNLYVIENTAAGTVRKVAAAGGVFTTLASGLNLPGSLAVDSGFV